LIHYGVERTNFTFTLVSQELLVIYQNTFHRNMIQETIVEFS
jgi:hypothetical protein